MGIEANIQLPVHSKEFYDLCFFLGLDLLILLPTSCFCINDLIILGLQISFSINFTHTYYNLLQLIHLSPDIFQLIPTLKTMNIPPSPLE